MCSRISEATIVRIPSFARCEIAGQTADVKRGNCSGERIRTVFQGRAVLGDEAGNEASQCISCACSSQSGITRGIDERPVHREPQLMSECL